MAVDKLVDSTQLDSDLTSVANAIRAKSGGSSQLAFPSGFVSEIGNIPSGGGSSDTIDSDYIKLEYAIVTIGANSVANATQVIPYLLGLADFSTTDALHAWCSVIDHNGWIQNQYVCTNINNSLDSSRKFYRYRNNAISSTQEGVSYDAKLNPGDKYLVSCIRWKGAPTV